MRKGSKKYSDTECIVEGCPKIPYARRHCKHHYRRVFVQKLPLFVPQSKGKCKHPGCENTGRTKGYCSFHYMRQRGGLDMDAPKGTYHQRKIDRNKAIALMYKAEYSMQSIGDIMGITRQRVERIIAKYG